MAIDLISLSLAMTGVALLGMERANPTSYLGPLGVSALLSALLLASGLGAGPALVVFAALSLLLWWAWRRRGPRLKPKGKGVPKRK